MIPTFIPLAAAANPLFSVYALALGVVLLLWLGVSLFVVSTRAIYDVRLGFVRTARAVIERRLDPAEGDPRGSGRPCAGSRGGRSNASLSVATFVLAFVLGAIDWTVLAQVLGIMAFSGAVLTSVAVLIADRTARDYRLRSLVRLILVGPFDLFLYRSIIMWARPRGTWDYLRKRRGWDKFERNAPEERCLTI